VSLRQSVVLGRRSALCEHGQPCAQTLEQLAALDGKASGLAPAPSRPTVAASPAAEPCPAAAEWKVKGNAAFKEGQMENAIAAYTRAIAALPRPNHPDASTFLSNRAACHKNLGAHGAVIADCTASLQLNPSNWKAQLRRGPLRPASKQGVCGSRCKCAGHPTKTKRSLRLRVRGGGEIYPGTRGHDILHGARPGGATGGRPAPADRQAARDD
jgi:tetratricopeptide (TPR) repeat protein